MKYANALIFLFLIIVTQIKAVFQVISQPGLYQLGENVTYSPAGPNDIIFQITSSDVEFDLGDRFIAQDGANVQTGLIAIQVASGLSNVTIKSGSNGSIQNIRGTGIQVLSSCSRIMLDNITTFSCEDRAIDFVGIFFGGEITDSQIQNCSVIGCCRNNTADTAIKLEACDNLSVNNVIVDSNGLSNDSLTLILVELCNSCNFDNIFMRNNTGLVNIIGLSLNTTFNSIFNNCIVANSVATGVGPVVASGYNVIGSTNNVFKNCQAIGLSSTNTCFGFTLNGCQTSSLENCIVMGMTSVNFIFGFDDESDVGTTFINCGAYHNTTGGPSYGFFIASTSQSSLIDCISNDQVSTGNIGVGFNLDTVSDTLMQNCIATRNTGTPVAANSFGVLAIVNTNDVYAHNIASRNGTVAANQFSGVAAGAVNNVAATAVNSAAIGPWTNLGIT